MPQGRIHCYQATFGQISVLLRPLHLPMQQLFGFVRSCEDCLLPRSRRRHGQRRHLLEHDRAEQALDFTARDGGADGSPISAFGPVACSARIDAPTRPALGRGGHVASTWATKNNALQQGRALTGWPLLVTGPLALHAFLVGLECLPAHVAWMGLLH